MPASGCRSSSGRPGIRAAGSNVVHHVGPVLRIDDMLRDLGQLVQTIRQQAGPPRGDIVRGALTLREDGVVLWKDVEVPLTPSERAIVKLLAWNFPQFVSYDAIYALGHVWARCTGSGRGRQVNECPVGSQKHSAEIPRLRPTVPRHPKPPRARLWMEGPRLSRSASRPGHTLAQQAVGAARAGPTGTVSRMQQSAIRVLKQFNQAHEATLQQLHVARWAPGAAGP